MSPVETVQLKSIITKGVCILTKSKMNKYKMQKMPKEQDVKEIFLAHSGNVCLS